MRTEPSTLNPPEPCRGEHDRGVDRVEESVATEVAKDGRQLGRRAASLRPVGVHAQVERPSLQRGRRAFP